MKKYEIKGLDAECGLKNVCNQEDVYDMVLETYCQEAEEKIARYMDVDEAYLRNNLQRTIVDMHGIKGASNGIGAIELGETFRKMEFAGKDGDIAYLLENMKPCMEVYQEMTVQILAMCEEFKTAGPVKNEDSLRTDVLDELLKSLEEVDFDRFEERMDELLDTDFGTDVNDVLKKVWNYYDNFDYDEAADLLEQLKG